MTGQIDLGARRVLRSAYAVKTAELTTSYLGTCERHNLPVREDKLGLDPALAPRTSLVLCFIDPDAEHEVIGHKLAAVTTSLDCDASCKSARRPWCSCGCGGVNHGQGWTRQFMIDHREIFETQLDAYRAEQVRITERRAARREAKAERARREFEEWFAGNAEDVQWLASLTESELDRCGNFVRDMATKIRNAQILSPNMMRVVVKIKSERAEREARQAEREAERASKPGAGDQSALVPGVYRLDGRVYVVVGNKIYIAWRRTCKDAPGTARPADARVYAKRLVESAPRETEAGTEIPFELQYDKGAIFRLTLSDRMPLAEAEVLTTRYGKCIAPGPNGGICGRRLRAAKSVRRGIGPVCIKYFGPVHPEDMH
jgi:Family of unknown function (DUF6011)